MRFDFRNRKPEVDLTYWPEPEYRKPEAGSQKPDAGNRNLSDLVSKKIFEIFKKVCKDTILFVLNQYFNILQNQFK